MSVISDTQAIKLLGRRGRRPFNYNPNYRPQRRRNRRNVPRRNGYRGNGGRRGRFQPLRWAARNVSRFIPGLRRFLPPRENPGPNLRGVQINKGIITKASVPKMGIDGNGNRIQHSEILKVIDTTNGGINGEYKINPGSKKVLPWCSNLACSYDTYKVNSISVRYVSSAPTTLIGRFYMYYDRDVVDDVAPTEQACAQMDGCVQTPLWDNAVLNVDVSDVPILFIRDDATVLTNRDPKTYDIGKFVFQVYASADTLKVGTFWVDYDFTLYRPQQSTATTLSEYHFEGENAESLTGTDISCIGTNYFSEDLPNAASSLTVENYFRGFLEVELTGTTITDIDVAFDVDTHGSNIISTGVFFASSDATMGKKRFMLEMFPGDLLAVTSTNATVTNMTIFTTDIVTNDHIDNSEFL